ncbi:hypothetical protein GCM10010339_20270 [Streptomyces alanosinicus]|uniref:Uncharacterized protein n=1 Tax=Streptomyces alanosinicus TaxID=68171 RepID=A0A918YEQ1_9ACTN|nr:hypothetical protein GCM10010339_20270 [Streptomyces alanosinicus]
MRETVHRHLGKSVAVAAVGTAAMAAVTRPGTAGAKTPPGAGSGGTQAGQGPDGVRPAVVERAPAEGARGTGRDPLTDDGIRRAEKIALNRQPPNTGESADGGRGPQRLSVDLAEPEAGESDGPHAPRRAAVTFHDYEDDTLVTTTVDLDTGKAERSDTQRGVRPPPSGAENTEAARLLIAAPLGAGLKADYKDATGRELSPPDQLLLSGGVYRAAPGAQPAVPRSSTGAARTGASGCSPRAGTGPGSTPGPW